MFDGILKSLTKNAGITDPDEYGITPLDRWGRQLGVLGGAMTGLAGGELAGLKAKSLPVSLLLPALGIMGGITAGYGLGALAQKKWGDPAGYHTLYTGGLQDYAKSIGKPVGRLTKSDVRNAVEYNRRLLKEKGVLPTSEEIIGKYFKDPRNITGKEFAEEYLGELV
jgi:hypothetical protein